MLNFFPVPIDDEWWYSILCRYYVSSGKLSTSSVKIDLFGKIESQVAPFFPNGTIYQIVRQLPSSVFNFDKILDNNTLYKYYARLFPKEKQEYMYQCLSKGESPLFTSMRVNYHGSFAPRYCPCCVKDDIKLHGFPYYHIAHQIPLAPSCFKHGCKLKQIQIVKGKSNYLSTFHPLSLEVIDDVCEESTDIEKLITSITYDFLVRPLSIGPTERYNNLVQELLNKEYCKYNKSFGRVFDYEKIMQGLSDVYGDDILSQAFKGSITNRTLAKIKCFAFTNTDIYVLLMGMLGMNFDDFLVNGRVPDIKASKIIELRDRYLLLSAGDAAKELGMDELELRAICKSCNIKPFWLEEGEYVKSVSPTRKVIIELTEAEFEKIRARAERSGASSVGEYLVKTALKNKGN